MSYPRASAEHLLEALRKLGFNEVIVGTVTFDGGGKISRWGEPFATYKYFDGMEDPLFDFEVSTLNDQRFLINLPVVKAQFHLSLGSNGQPRFFIRGQRSTKILRTFLYDEMFNPKAPGFSHTRNSGAVFVDGTETDANIIELVFLKPKGAQGFIEYVNEQCAFAPAC